MQELEKILEKMGFLIKFYPGGDAPIGLKGMYAGMIQACEIIKKHMNDGWIPAEKELPEEHTCIDKETGYYGRSDDVLCSAYDDYTGNMKCGLIIPWMDNGKHTNGMKESR